MTMNINVGSSKTTASGNAKFVVNAVMQNHLFEKWGPDFSDMIHDEILDALEILNPGFGHEVSSQFIGYLDQASISVSGLIDGEVVFSFDYHLDPTTGEENDF